MSRPVPYTHLVDEVLTASRMNTEVRDAVLYLLGDEAGQESVVFGKPLESNQSIMSFRMEQTAAGNPERWRFYKELASSSSDGDGVQVDFGVQDSVSLIDYVRQFAGRRSTSSEAEFWLDVIEGGTFDSSNPDLYIGQGAVGIRNSVPSISSVEFNGSGLDDMTAGGSFDFSGAPSYPLQYVAEIDGTGTPDTFKWSDDGGATWDATGVAITGSAQTLNNGVTITFGATTGHTLADRWAFGGGVRFKVPGAIDATEILKNGQPFSGGNWGTSGPNVYYSTGNVGIGVSSPSQLLDVQGGNIRTDNQLISTLAAGTAPLVVASDTLVSNLNANLLQGSTWQTPDYLRTSYTSTLSTWTKIGDLTAPRSGHYIILCFAGVSGVNASDTGATFFVRANPASSTVFTGYEFGYKSATSGDYGTAIGAYYWQGSAGTVIDIDQRQTSGTGGLTTGLLFACLLFFRPV